MTAFLVILGLLALIFGAVLLFWSSMTREKEGLGAGETLALDDLVLVSERLKILGRPDRIVRQGEFLIPEEWKPSARRIYPGHRLQLGAYCAARRRGIRRQASLRRGRPGRWRAGRSRKYRGAPGRGPRGRRENQRAPAEYRAGNSGKAAGREVPSVRPANELRPGSHLMQEDGELVSSVIVHLHRFRRSSHSMSDKPERFRGENFRRQRSQELKAGYPVPEFPESPRQAELRVPSDPGEFANSIHCYSRPALQAPQEALERQGFDRESTES